MKKIFTLLAVVVVGAAQANLLTNGSFENTVIAINNYAIRNAGSTDITGWVISGTSVDQVSGPSRYIAQDGNQAVDLAGTPGPGAVAQSFASVIGQEYQVDFYLGSNHEQSGDKSVDVTINGVTENLTGGLTNGTWVHFTRSFIATGLSTEIKFASTSAGNYGGMVDNVSVEAVPEPATMTVLAAAGLMALRRRKSK